MGRHLGFIGKVTIPLNGTESNELHLPNGAEAMIDMLVFAPAALTGTITVKLAPTNDGPVSGDYKTFQYVPGTDWTIAAGKAVPLQTGDFGSLKFVSNAGGGEVAARDFIIMAQLDYQAGLSGGL